MSFDMELTLIKGKNMKNQTTIFSDTYYISERLKEIDESYFIVFNFDKGKFEVHSSAQTGSTYCLTVPYKTLDERTLNLVRKTNHARLDELVKEMEIENAKKQKQIEKQVIECSSYLNNKQNKKNT